MLCHLQVQYILNTRGGNQNQPYDNVLSFAFLINFYFYYYLLSTFALLTFTRMEELSSEQTEKL